MAEQVAKVKEGIRIMKCNCEHPYQDSVYGIGMRVHNVSRTGRASCTVCTPNYRIWRMSPTDDIMPSPVMKNGFIPKKTNREQFVKKVA